MALAPIPCINTTWIEKYAILTVASSAYEILSHDHKKSHKKMSLKLDFTQDSDTKAI